MSETKKRQQVILLHGSDEFTLAKAQEKTLVKGELVVEHGEKGVKLHTLDKDNKLATFINEAAINAEFAKTNQAVEANTGNIEALQETVGNAEGGLVKDVATHSADIQEIRESLGLEAKPGDSTLAERIADLELAVGDDTKGLVKDVADNASAIETHIGNYDEYVEANDAKNELFEAILTGYDEENTVAGALAQEVEDRNQAIADAISTFKTTTIDGIAKDVEDALDGVGDNAVAIGTLQSVLKGYEGESSVATAVAAAKTEVKAAAVAEDAKQYVSVTEEPGENGQTVYSIGVTGFADGKDFEDLEGRVNTLVGDVPEDGTKSVRTIANEELAAQLLSGKADADFKTLQALAAWLEEHPEEVADINAAIANLQKALTDYTAENAVKNAFAEVGKTTDGLNTRLETVETDYINSISANCEVAVAAQTDAEGKFTHEWAFDFSSLKIDGGEY